MKYRSLLSPRTAKVAQDATFLRRACAFIIDLLIIDLLVTAPFTPLFTSMISRAQHSSFLSMTYTHREIAAMLLLFAIIYMYFVLFEYLLGQTPGMMLADIQVQGTGLGALLVRNSLFIPVFPFVALWLIEPVAILLWRRSLLEQLSGTRTIHQRQIII